MRYYLKEDTEINEEYIAQYIEADAANHAKMLKLNDYYKGTHNILNRTFEDPNKPNNMLVNPFARYITDLSTGYFMGKPIEYIIENEQYEEVIKNINDLNGETAEDADLAKDASIFGYACEILYLENVENEVVIKFHNVSPLGTIMIYSDTINPKLMYFIRYYDYTDILNDETITYVDVYTSTEIRHYSMDGDTVTYLSSDSHAWGEVPVVIYQNNREEIGDFEPVISLIDAYDILESDSVNDTDYFSDAYLALKGVDGTSSEDISTMKENRVMLLPEGADASWLIKEVNGSADESLKTRIADDIHKFSFTPAMTDESFASNSSGVAMKYKLMGLENATAKKERSFKKGLEKRYSLINKMLELVDRTYETAMSIVFTRNLPENITEMAEVIQKVGHLYSEDTQRQLLPFSIDTTTEENKKEAEESAE